jgi:PilZ domain-containing protein
MSRVEKRGRDRSKMVIGLRVSNTKNKSDAAGTMVHTLDISPTGARLAGLREQVEPGDILILHRQHKRAKCKVVWCREVAPREIQLGIQFIEADAAFWGVDLAQNTKVSDEKKMWSLLGMKEK